MGFSSWDILSHFTKISITLQQKAVNGFCKLYLEAQTGYRNKNILSVLFPEPIKNLIYFETRGS